MGLFNRFYLVTMLLLVFSYTYQGYAAEKPWTGTLQNGTKIDEKGLAKILSDHIKWLETKGKYGKQAILSGANLQKAMLMRANFQEAELMQANLQEANLKQANLIGTNLIQANLQKAKLLEANLQSAQMDQANLQGAYLGKASLQRSILGRANLKEAYLGHANLQWADAGQSSLQHADLSQANLKGANLGQANLQGAYLVSANLQGANLGQANLQRAHLGQADLQWANLLEANLQSAKLERANLQRAILVEANLQGANLIQADLQEAEINEADLADCLLYGVNKLPFGDYEPKAGSTPYIPSIINVPWLKDLSFIDKVHGLVDLQEGFKKLGYREQEREITYAIMHTKTRQLLDESIFWGYVNLILFEWTCEWGMNPLHSFILIFYFILFFSFFYSVSLALPKKKDGIWKIWVPERVRNDLPQAPKDNRPVWRKKRSGAIKPELLYCKNPLEFLRYSIYFSFLSAFQMGWRDLNVGNWLARLQFQEYRLQATGWVRFLSGLQSIISLYLLALSVLTYFGRPFESY